MVMLDLTKEQKYLLPFTEGITAVEGKKGSGKTTAAIALAWKVRELFGMPIVCDFPLKEEFGPYTHLDIPRFLDDLRTVSAATKGHGTHVAERAVDMLFKTKYPSIEGCFMILDEAYKYVDSRTPNDRVVRLFGYWISQIRHFRTSLILIVPHMDMVDKRVARQVDRIARCYTDQRREKVVCLVSDILRGKPTRLTIDASKYWPMFDSWVLTPFRMAHLSVGAEGERPEGTNGVDKAVEEEVPTGALEEVPAEGSGAESERPETTNGTASEGDS